MSVTPAGVDSSGWIEMFKWVLREHSEAQAIQAVAAMAINIILATARIHQARSTP